MRRLDNVTNLVNIMIKKSDDAAVSSASSPSSKGSDRENSDLENDSDFLQIPREPKELK